LSKKKLKNLRDKLELEKVEMKPGDFNHINIKTKQGIKLRIFEDGLIVLNTDYVVAKEDVLKLTNFYEKKLSPALSYLFSLGAPVPKELANIKTVYPYFIVLDNAKEEEISQLLKDFEEDKYFEIKKDEFEIYRGDKLYIINNIKEKIEVVERFINEQVFVREFKSQLHRYLNLHRIIWEKIADIKERGEIAGKEAGELKSKIESYKKTINLIESRINQMGVYVSTRGAVVKNDPELQRIVDILQFKYETLSNTLAYVKEIWATTKNYVDSALDTFSSIQSESTEASIKNLTVITTTGVAASLIRLFGMKFPDLSINGLTYFLVIVFVGYSANKILQIAAVHKKYKIKNIEIDKSL